MTGQPHLGKWKVDHSLRCLIVKGGKYNRVDEFFFSPGKEIAMLKVEASG